MNTKQVGLLERRNGLEVRCRRSGHAAGTLSGRRVEQLSPTVEGVSRKQAGVLDTSVDFHKSMPTDTCPYNRFEEEGVTPPWSVERSDATPGIRHWRVLSLPTSQRPSRAPAQHVPAHTDGHLRLNGAATCGAL